MAGAKADLTKNAGFVILSAAKDLNHSNG